MATNGTSGGQGGMIAPVILGGLSALGGIFGRKKRKYMDPAMYNQLYGAKAIGDRTQQLVNQIINSPYGQQLMQGAATQGQELQTGINRSAEQAGFGASGGAQSGASDFGVAAAPQAVGALQRGVTGNLWQGAMPIAQQMVNREGQLALDNMESQNNEPTLMGRIGQAASGVMSGMGGGDMDWAGMLKKLRSGGGGGTMGYNTLSGGGGGYSPVSG